MIMDGKYHNQTMQTSVWHHEEEAKTRTIKCYHEDTKTVNEKQPTISLPLGNDRKTGKDIKYCIIKQRPTINYEHTTTEPLPKNRKAAEAIGGSLINFTGQILTLNSAVVKTQTS